ncbi:hypothetical protein [Bradyrhizobium sp.]|jgi:hypothetical protein|uniref:hypothetical protein n=1 Tax=Bradyrhizobium sp. TaxID=376 RepID=UPI002D8042FB|nr:hypothetical protein [Bradyrhizobium sp.]
MDPDTPQMPDSPAAFLESARDYPGFSPTYPPGASSNGSEQCIVPAHYLFHHFNDLPNNIAAVAAGSLFEQILNRRADCRLGVLDAIKII